MDTQAPPQETLAWVARHLGTSAVRCVRPLLGGTHARTDMLVTADGRTYVLRQYSSGEDAVHREALVLRLLDGLGGLAPRVVAADPDGSHVHRPTILTTKLPGTPCVTPRDPESWASQLGRALARIHATAPRPGLPQVLTPPPADAVGDAAAAVHDSWDRLAAAPGVLTHQDFWSGNTLWQGDQLSGVVDWSGAGLAPRGFDVSWCRLDLILLYDVATADVFTAAYESAIGAPVHDLDLWDLSAALNADLGIESWSPNYVPLGRPDLTPSALRARLSEWSPMG